MPEDLSSSHQLGNVTYGHDKDYCTSHDKGFWFPIDANK